MTFPFLTPKFSTIAANSHTVKEFLATFDSSDFTSVSPKTSPEQGSREGSESRFVRFCHRIRQHFHRRKETIGSTKYDEVNQETTRVIPTVSPVGLGLGNRVKSFFPEESPCRNPSGLSASPVWVRRDSYVRVSQRNVERWDSFLQRNRETSIASTFTVGDSRQLSTFTVGDPRQISSTRAVRSGSWSSSSAGSVAKSPSSARVH